MKALLTSNIRKVDSTGMSLGTISYPARLREWWRHEDGKPKIAANMKLAIKDTAGGNTAMGLKGPKTDSKRKGNREDMSLLFSSHDITKLK